MIGIAVVGYGYWGPNLVRNFGMVDGATVVAVGDRSAERREVVRKLYPATKQYEEYADLLADPAVDAVVIATPVKTHFALAMAALAAGKHVLVEKPMVGTVAEAETLVAEAERLGLVLMVDHTFVYTSAVRKISELVRSGRLGRLQYYDSVRVNLGLFQSDVSVLWDLAVHDLAIMDFLVGQPPVQVAATGMSHVPGRPANMAYLTCYFEGDFIAHFHVNWLAPVKLRQTMICGTEQMIVFDDIEMSEKIRVYDKGLIFSDQSDELYQRHVGYRTGDMWAPRIDNIEALEIEANHFVDCVRTGATPQTDGHAGLRIVRILDAATRSLEQRGTPVVIEP
jgi:predicted dehydrogenase